MGAGEKLSSYPAPRTQNPTPFLLPARGREAQRLAGIPVGEFPLLAPDGKMHLEPFYTVMGFAPSKYGVAILGRASQKQVVNVALRGGLCVVMVGHQGVPLLGPAEPERRRPPPA